MSATDSAYCGFSAASWQSKDLSYKLVERSRAALKASLCVRQVFLAQKKRHGVSSLILKPIKPTKQPRVSAFRAPPRDRIAYLPLTAYRLLTLRRSFRRYRSRLTSYHLPAAIPHHPNVHTPMLVIVFLTFIQAFLRSPMSHHGRVWA